MTESSHTAAESAPLPGSDNADDSQKRAKVVRRSKILAVVVLVLLALGATRTVVSRMSNSRSLEEGTAERAKVYVKVTTPKTGDSGQTLSLPGTLQGFVQSPIAARVERLSPPLVQGHRRPRRKRRAARRDRDSRNRPAAFAGHRRATAGRRQSRSRPQHHGTLGRPAQEGRRLAAGAGGKAQQQRAGSRQSRCRRRQRRAPAAAGRLQAPRGPVRRA